MGSTASHGTTRHPWGQQHAMGLLDTLWDQSAPVGLLNTRQNPWISCRSLGYLQNQRTPHGAPKYPMGAGSTLGAPQHPMEYRDTCRYPVLSTGPHSIPDLIPGNCGSSRHPHDPTSTQWDPWGSHGILCQPWGQQTRVAPCPNRGTPGRPWDRPYTIHRILSYPSRHPWDPELPRRLPRYLRDPRLPTGTADPARRPRAPKGRAGGRDAGVGFGGKTVGFGVRSHLVEILVVEQVGLAGLEAVLALALVEDVGLELPAGIVLGGHGAARARCAPAQRPAERPPAAAPIAAAPRPRGASGERKNQHRTPANTAGKKNQQRERSAGRPPLLRLSGRAWPGDGGARRGGAARAVRGRAGW